MRIGVGIGTEALGQPATPDTLADQAVHAESQGFPAAWCVHFSRGIDALSALVPAGLRTTVLDLGVGVVPVQPRHPVALAQQAATVQALVGGRLTLGVGVSHRPVIEGMFGLSYQGPAAYLREYLAVLVPLLEHGRVSFHGETFRVEAEVTVPGTSPVDVIVGALSPQMVRAAAELAAGVVTWLAGPRTLGEQIVPWARAAAEAAGRPAPRVVAALPISVCDDAGAARERAGTVFARYAGLTNYQQVFDREGVSAPGELAIVGSEDVVTAALRDLAGTGVTELWPVVFPSAAGQDCARTMGLLADLAARGL